MSRATISREAEAFLTSNEVAVLSTVSRSGEVQGATVYYSLTDGYFYILTKSESSKAHNMMAHPQVAMTIYDADEIKTIQLLGEAQIEGDMKTKRVMFDKLVRPRNYGGDQLMPPVTELSAGGFILFRIQPTRVMYADYKSSRVS